MIRNILVQYQTLKKDGIHCAILILNDWAYFNKFVPLCFSNFFIFLSPFYLPLVKVILFVGDVKALKVAVAAKGPISVGIDAAHKSLRNDWQPQ